MNRIVVLIGSLSMFAAGTASAQTSVSVSIGFGVPRPYLVGSVFIGRPHLRPVYRPYFHRYYPDRFFYAPRPHAYRPLILVPSTRFDHRSRGLILVERGRLHRGHRERRFERGFDRD